MRPFLLLLAACTAHLAAEDWRVATLAPSKADGAPVVLGLGDATRLDAPMGMAVLGDGSVVVVDTGLQSLVRISGGGRAQLLAGGMGATGAVDGTGAAARFLWPQFVAQAPDGTLVVSDSGNHTIRRVTLAGVVTTIAGSPGQYGSADGQGAAARFRNPAGVAVDAAGTIYVVDRVNMTIRRIGSDGQVTTLAGLAGSHGTSDGVGSAARFMVPYGMALAGSSLFITDAESGTIRRIDTTTATVSTYAGMAGWKGWADGDFASARFKYPQAIAADPAGNLFVGDTGSSTLRRIDRSGAGSVATIAGNGSIGNADGLGAAARLFSPLGLAIGGDRQLYIADTYNYRLCKAAPAGAPLFLWIDGDAGGTTGGSALVHGANLAGLTAATLGGQPAALSGVSATSARVACPAHAAGLVDLTLAAGAVTTTQSGAYRYLEMTVLDPAPAKMASSLGGTTLTFAGSRLDEVTAAVLGGSAATITGQTAASLVLIAPAHAAGSADLALATPLGTVTATGAVLYLAPPQLDPVASRLASTLGGTALEFTGNGLTAATAARVGGATAAITASTASRLTVVAPAHAAGNADLELDWSLGTVLAAGAVLYRTAPAVSATAAATIDIAGGAELRFAGSDLDRVTAARLGGTAATIIATTATSLALRAPAHAAGSVDLELDWMLGTVLVAGVAVYRDPAAPEVVVTTTVIVDPAGGTLTLAGSNLDRVTAARVGGTAATIISQTATSLVLRAPPHAAGSVDLALDWGGSTVVVPGAVVYGTPPAPTPVLLPAAPAVGAMGGGGGGGGGCGLGGVGLLLGLAFMLARRVPGR
ncbi:MAG: IPT/TIG domain-containing protein [Planctomycetes bacterium]|nr:IPT/TIG domain-containing protein [Planctomycetota bacterium]